MSITIQRPPNPTCCSRAEHLCPKCQVLAKTVKRRKVRTRRYKLIDDEDEMSANIEPLELPEIDWDRVHANIDDDEDLDDDELDDDSELEDDEEDFSGNRRRVSP